jgi:hypothetical protein
VEAGSLVCGGTRFNCLGLTGLGQPGLLRAGALVGDMEIPRMASVAWTEMMAGFAGFPRFDCLNCLVSDHACPRVSDALIIG